MLQDFFNKLHNYKIREKFDDKDIQFYYFYCNDKKMLFIKKSRNLYKLMASCQCNLEYIDREYTFDVIATSKSLQEIKEKFALYVYRLNYGMYSTDSFKTEE